MESTTKYTKGHEWYFIQKGRIRRCQYLCEFPFNNPVNLGGYHIIIWKDSDEPERIYHKKLEELIEKYSHIKTYEEAKVEYIKEKEKEFESIKKIYAP